MTEEIVPSPEDLLLERERVGDILKSLDEKIKDRYLEFYFLRVIDKMKYKDIAKKMNLSITQCRVKVEAAKWALYKAYIRARE